MPITCHPAGEPRSPLRLQRVDCACRTTTRLHPPGRCSAAPEPSLPRLQGAPCGTSSDKSEGWGSEGVACLKSDMDEHISEAHL